MSFFAPRSEVEKRAYSALESMFDFEKYFKWSLFVFVPSGAFGVLMQMELLRYQILLGSNWIGLNVCTLLFCGVVYGLLVWKSIRIVRASNKRDDPMTDEHRRVLGFLSERERSNFRTVLFGAVGLTIFLALCLLSHFAGPVRFSGFVWLFPVGCLVASAYLFYFSARKWKTLVNRITTQLVSEDRTVTH